MKTEFKLPTEWTETQVEAGRWVVECPKCHTPADIEASSLSSMSGTPDERLQPLGVSMTYLTNGLARLAWVGAALITFVAVFTIVPTSDFAKATEGMTYLVAIPVFFGSQFFLRWLLSISGRVDLRKLECGTCQQDLVIASKGSLLISGKPGEPKASAIPLSVGQRYMRTLGIGFLGMLLFMIVGGMIIELGGEDSAAVRLPGGIIVMGGLSADAWFVAKEKGRNPILWAILTFALFPVLFLLLFLPHTDSRRAELSATA